MAGWDPSSLLVGLLLLFHTWAGVWADVVVNMEDRMEVYRRDTAHITCMFESSEGIGGVIIQWLYVTRTGEKQMIFYQDSTMKNVEKNTRFTNRMTVNGTGATGVVVLTINDVQLEDEVEFICLIKMLTEGVGEGRTRLKVFEKPDLPSIEAVLTGISVSDAGPSKVATCEVKNGYPKPNVTWYRNTAPLRNDQDVVKIVPTSTIESSGLYSIKSELSLKVVKEDKDAEFYCEVDFLVPGETRMMESERINITVYYPSTEVDIWVESPKGNIKVGDTVELRCQGNGNNPARLISIKHAITEQTWETDKLVLENVTLGNGGVYICSYIDMETFLEITGQTEVHVNFLHPAEVIPQKTVVVQGQKVMATCNALSSLHSQTAWFKDGKEVSTSHTLLLEDATFHTAGTYECRIWVPDMEGLTTKGTLLVEVHGAPQITKPDNTDIEESFENTVELSCDVRGLPAPAVTWTTSDGKVLKTATQSVTEERVLSVVRVKVTSDITAFCNASNDYGSDALAFNIRAIINTTTAATTTTTTTTASTSISPSTVKAETAIPPKKLKKEGNGVIIAVIIICILLLAVLGSVLYFLYKKGKICGRSGKQDLTKEKSSKDNIVVEMKSDNTEEAVLLGINGEKQPQSNQ